MTNIVTYPTNPVQGQEFTLGETIKVWDGEKWVNKTPTNNPHNVTKSQVGLGDVDNVSAANLRDRGTHTGTQSLSTISDAGSAASKDVGVSDGVASLDGSGKVPDSESQVSSVSGKKGDVELNLSDIKVNGGTANNVVKAQLISQGLSGNYGFFEEGFNYTVEGDIGIDADGNSWIYVGAGAPNKVVDAGTVPSVGDGYQQVTFNNLPASDISNANGGSVQDYIDGNLTPFKTVADMKAAVFLSTLPEFTRVEWQGYHAQSDGGSNWGVLRFGTHTEDGGSIFSIDANTYIEANLKGKRINSRKFGVKANGSHDDTINLQSVVDYAPRGSTIYHPEGNYMIKATGDAPNGSVGGVLFKRSVKWVADKGAIFKAITGNKDNSQILGSIYQTTPIDGIEICGGTYIGDRDTNTNTTEWGHGISLANMTNVYIHDLDIRDCKGDGLYLGFGNTLNGNILVENVNISRVRRWGITYTTKGNATFRNVHISDHQTGLGFGGGVDMEDQFNHNEFSNIKFERCSFIDLSEDNGAITLQGMCKRLQFIDCVFSNNKYELNLGGGLSTVDQVTLDNCEFKNTIADSVIIARGSPMTNLEIKGCVAENLGSSKFLEIGGSSSESFKNVTVTGCSTKGTGSFVNAQIADCDIAIFTDNIIEGSTFGKTTKITNLKVTGGVVTGTNVPFSLSGKGAVIESVNIISHSNDAILINDDCEHLKLKDNNISGFSRFGVRMFAGASGCTISGNSIDASLSNSTVFNCNSVPTRVRSAFINNIVESSGTGTNFSINEAHLSVGNDAL